MDSEKDALRVLLVEDCEDDARLLLRELRRNGCEPRLKRVETREGLEAELAESEWDIVVSDHVLPRFDSFSALEVLKKSGRDIPFIVVSGSIGEETAVEILHAGADDYIMKNNMARLYPSIKRSLEDARLRREHKSAEEALRQSNDALHEANRRIKENQARLIQTEKMASLGQLAAGIAHEINNPLGYVISNLETLSNYVDVMRDMLSLYEKLETAGASDVSALREIAAFKEKNRFEEVRTDLYNLLRETREGTTHIRDIIQRLKIFVRSDEDELQTFNINESIETALKLTWNELKYKCKVHKKLGELPLVRCYPGRLSQVFMNFLVNAAQAIPEQGEITVESGAEDGRIFIKIADNGDGIKAEHLPKIFTPFFTTKPRGTGTGLGLSISHGIIMDHNGSIDVKSREKEGTTFTIFIPMEPRSAAGQPLRN